MRRSLRYVIVGVIMSAPVASYAQDIRDVKPPVAFPTHWMALFVALLVLVLLGTGYFFYYKYRHRAQITTPGIIKTPWEKAYERLDALVNSDLLKRGEWEKYYLTLSDIVRRYFEERFNVRAPEMTSEEFLMSLRNFDGLSAESKNLLEEFLGVCDMVKFAKHSPGPAEGEKHAALARRLIDETKGQHIRQSGYQEIR